MKELRVRCDHCGREVDFSDKSKPLLVVSACNGGLETQRSYDLCDPCGRAALPLFYGLAFPAGRFRSAAIGRSWGVGPALLLAGE